MFGFELPPELASARGPGPGEEVTRDSDVYEEFCPKAAALGATEE